MAFQESGNNPHKKGESSEYGALQYKKSTWVCASTRVTGEVLKQTPQNEWYVSAIIVQQFIDKHPTWGAYEIAMVWNGTLCGSDKPVAKKGINKYNKAYDTEKHAKNVARIYQQLTNEL